jgi:hypothetical protein
MPFSTRIKRLASGNLDKNEPLAISKANCKLTKLLVGKMEETLFPVISTYPCHFDRREKSQMAWRLRPGHRL